MESRVELEQHGGVPSLSIIHKKKLVGSFNTLNITPALSMKFIYIRVRPTRSTSEGLSDRGSVDASEEEVGL